MQFRAVIKKSDGWWIGWLVDLPGVNAQERSREKLIESLRIGAEDMLNTPVEPKAEEELVQVEGCHAVKVPGVSEAPLPGGYLVHVDRGLKVRLNMKQGRMACYVRSRVAAFEDDSTGVPNSWAFAGYCNV